MNFIEFFREFQSIIGAILGGVFGTVATLVTTNLLRHKGKIYIYVNKWELGLDDKQYNSAVDKGCNRRCFLGIDLFNNTQVPKSLRDIRIEFVAKDISTGESDLDIDCSNNNQVQLSRFINLPPNKFVHINLSGQLDKEDLSCIRQGANLYIKAKDYKGRTIVREILNNNG